MAVAVNIPGLKEKLDAITILEPLNDPVRLVRRFGSPDDAELAGLLISAIAYGRVHHIMKSASRLVDLMDGKPAQFIAGFEEEGAPKLAEFKHRFTRDSHIACLIVRLKHVLNEYGSVHGLFEECWSRSSEMGEAISCFVRQLLSIECPGLCDDCRASRRQDIRWLLSGPGSGGAAKRMCLFLRWMVRDTYPDIGVWREIPKSSLVMPLDTHVARIGRLLGLTRRRSADWLTALEITAALRHLDSEDPLRYDYALSHLGIDGGCSGKFDAATCSLCEVEQFCIVAQNRAAST